MKILASLREWYEEDKRQALTFGVSALALALSYMENLFPLTLAIPLPGVKLGLANIVTVFALYALGAACPLCAARWRASGVNSTSRRTCWCRWR